MWKSLGISAVHPALLWAASGVAAPILIHLWNRRRLHVVDWAAMDFLWEAERRTRRRVQLENLLLMALRCLAVALIAALVSRPLLTPSAAAQPAGGRGLERVVVLDDSPSMTQHADRGSLFDLAKSGLADWVRASDAAQAADLLTLFLTSRPESPAISRASTSGQHAAELLAQIESLAPSDLPARYAAVFRAVAARLRNDPTNQAVWIVTDARSHDWLETEPARGEPESITLLREIAAQAERCLLVDLAPSDNENLLVEEVNCADGVLVSGVEARLEARVHNAGLRDARDVEVRLVPSDGAELRRRIDHLGPGESAVVPFSYMFGNPGTAQLRVRLTTGDPLSIDDQRPFVATVLAGQPELVIDGDPRLPAALSESFYLARALAPPGAAASGNLVEMVAESQWDESQLDRYRVIWLLNPFRLSDVRVAALEAWVNEGGGLVIALGNQTDEADFNRVMFREGQGLSPLRLVSQAAASTPDKLARLVVTAPSHPVMAVLDGQQNPLLSGVAFRQFWQSSTAGEASADWTLLASLDDAERSPAIAERRLGTGRVVVCTFPLDADWCTWPSEPSFVLTMLELSHYLARGSATANNLQVGQRWRGQLDPARYLPECRLLPPQGEPVTLAAAPAVWNSDQQSEPPASRAQATRLPGPTRSPAGDQRRYVAESEALLHAGLYRVERFLRSGGVEVEPFTVSIDPSEGELRKAGDAALLAALHGAPIELVHDLTALSDQRSRGRAELWPSIAIGLVTLLCVEQTLAWWFGIRRQ